MRNGVQDTVMQAFLFENVVAGETRKRSVKEYRKGAKERLHTVPGDRRARPCGYTHTEAPIQGKRGTPSEKWNARHGDASVFI